MSVTAPGVTVRPATPADLDGVAALFDQYRQFYGQAPDAAVARQFIGQRLQQGDSLILLAESGGGPLAGFCQLYPSLCSVEAAPIYVLYDLFVNPAQRQRGCGRKLLQVAAARASADGKVRMDLTTARSNLQAQALYASEGWIRDGVFLTYTRRISAGA